MAADKRQVWLEASVAEGREDCEDTATLAQPGDLYSIEVDK
jgi:hypothetical protein